MTPTTRLSDLEKALDDALQELSNGYPRYIQRDVSEPVLAKVRPIFEAALTNLQAEADDWARKAASRETWCNRVLAETLETRARAEAAERVQEGLRAERDQWEANYRDECDLRTANVEALTRGVISRADAEAIAIRTFDSWLVSSIANTPQSCRDALSRAFQGSAEPPIALGHLDSCAWKRDPFNACSCVPPPSVQSAEPPTPDDMTILRHIAEWRQDEPSKLNAVGLIVTIDQILRDRLGLPHNAPLPPPSVQSDPIPARQWTFEQREMAEHSNLPLSEMTAKGLALCDGYGHVWSGILGEPAKPGQVCDCGQTTWPPVSASERPTRETLDALSDQPALDAALHTTDTLSATDDSHRHPPAISDLPGAPTTKRFCPGAHSFDKGVCTWCGFSYPKSESHAACHDVVCNADMGSARGGDGCSCVGRQKRIEAENTRRSALIEQLTTALVEAKTAERDTLARARAAVEAVLHADADPFEQPGLNAALRALDALAASASDHREPG